MFKRLIRYINVMIPLHVTLPVAIASFFSAYYLALRAVGQFQVSINLQLCFGAVTYALMIALLRVMDDIKDFDADKVYFSNRPTVQSLVSKRDLYVALIVIMAAMIALNLFMAPLVQLAFAVLMVYALLMFKYFFYPRISKSLILAVVTHNPVVPIGVIYIISFAVVSQPWTKHLLDLSLIVILYWLPYLAWEFGRKIRRPKDETEYETYSQIFGYRGASLIVAALLLAIFAVAGVLTFRLNLSPWLLAVLGVVIAGVLVRLFGFMLRPKKRMAGFKPELEAVIAATNIAFLIFNLVA